MSNLLKSELYRFSRQKSTRVLLIVFFVLTLFEVFAAGLPYGDAPWIASMFDQSRTALETSGLYSQQDINALFSVYESAAVSSILSYFALVFPANFSVFMALFVYCFLSLPLRNGCIMNYLGRYNRKEWFLVRSVMLLIISGCLALIELIACLLVSGILFESLTLGNVPLFAGFILMEIGLMFTLGLVFCLFIDVLKNKKRGGVIVVLYSLILASYVYSIIDTILSAIMGSATYLEMVTPLGNLQLLDYDKPISFIQAAFTLIVYTAFCFFAELKLMKNKDLI